MKVTNVFRANDANEFLKMTSSCGPLACATIATGQLRKMNIIHLLEPVGPKIAALHGMGVQAQTCEIDESSLFDGKMTPTPTLESIIQWTITGENELPRDDLST